ncbi:MAG: pilus assembly protein [Thermodesulfobacteriota bacterium]
MKNAIAKRKMQTALVSCLIPLVIFFDAAAEDLDVHRSSVKNNAMMVVDASGSMSWPVYDEAIQYGALMKWMIDENLAYDENHGRNGSSWWDSDGEGADYDRLDPDRIYLVSTCVEYRIVPYTDSDGGQRHAAVIGDVLQNIGSETDPVANKRLPFLRHAVIPARSRANVWWDVTDMDTIETNADGKVLFPTGELRDMDGNSVAVPSTVKGAVLPNFRDIAATEVIRESETGESLDRGFRGMLKAGGFYFSGLFEKSGAALEFTAESDGAELCAGRRIYVFATGNWINFLKLVEDFHVAPELEGCTAEGAYPVDRYKAWRSSYCVGEGAGGKIQSRLDTVKAVIRQVVAENRGTIHWGLTISGGISGAAVLAPLGTAFDTIMERISGLQAGGGSMGAAIQDAYNSDKLYLDERRDGAACARNYLLLMTDGSAAGDTTVDSDWSRINDAEAAAYPNPTFGFCASGYGGCASYGDGDNWPGGDHADDAAHWMFHQASWKHSLHVIGFGLDNPLLGDVAASGNGVYLSAYNRPQLINAFQRLGTVISSAVSFTVPVVSVDQSNRTQSGESLYMAFSLPEEGESWRGNLKKYGLQWKDRSDCGRPDPEWVVVDQNGDNATECSGQFKANSVSHWSTTTDGGDVSAGGAGEVLMMNFSTVSMAAGPYYDFRNIYTCKDPAVSTDMVRFFRDGNAGQADTITKEDLGVANNNLRDKIINYVYGYTYSAGDADGDPGTYSEATDGKPLGKREWILGDMIHSEPLVVDYFDENFAILHRLLVIGANDGMLHVFVDDADSASSADTTIGGVVYPPGSEVWAFIPGDLLGELKNFADPSVHKYYLDGSAVVHRSRTFHDSNGDGVMDSGEYTHQTLVFGQRRGGRSYWALDVTDPNPANWTVKWRIQGGVGGDFHELGHSWSKPMVARIQTGANIRNTTDVVVFGGGYDNQEDNYPEPWTDDNGNGVFNSGTETYTDANRNGSYDYYNPTMNGKGRGIFVVNLSDGSLRFKATYDAADLLTGTSQTDNDMKFCFPADPTVIETNQGLLVYITDIYGTVWKVSHDYLRADQWLLSRVFSANPGSNQDNAVEALSGPAALNPADKGRKAFYSPDVSYYGCDWTDYPMLYYGTGDREHPRYIPSYDNRFYAVADTGTPADETDLLNLTCDELDDYADVDLNGSLGAADNTAKEELHDIMYGDTDYPVTGEKARGWYKVMGGIGDCTQDGTDHTAEMVLSAVTLFYSNVFFTTYQPVFGDPCNPKGNARIYGLEYSFGKAAMNMDRVHEPVLDGTDANNVQDTHTLVENSRIPSGVRIITREGHAAAFVSAGGRIVGAGEQGDEAGAEGASSDIPGPPGGAQQIIWKID